MCVFQVAEDSEATEEEDMKEIDMGTEEEEDTIEDTEEEHREEVHRLEDVHLPMRENAKNDIE